MTLIPSLERQPFSEVTGVPLECRATCSVGLVLGWRNVLDLEPRANNSRGTQNSGVTLALCHSWQINLNKPPHLFSRFCGGCFFSDTRGHPEPVGWQAWLGVHCKLLSGLFLMGL